MKAIIFGATGMVGQGALNACLNDPKVSQVLVVGRTALSRTHPKMLELVQAALLAGSGLLLAAGTGVAMADRHASRPRLTINAPPERQLNILMILTDQERHGSLLPKGLALPNHDRLFARSTRFSNMNGVSGLCSIARGTIYTGQHYQHNGVYENVPIPFANDLYPHVATLGTMMQDAGYETAYFGKWHLTRLPTTTDVGAEHMAALFKSYGFDVSNQPGGGRRAFVRVQAGRLYRCDRCAIHQHAQRLRSAVVRSSQPAQPA